MTAVRIAIPQELNNQLLQLQTEEYPFLNLSEMFKLGVSKLYAEHQHKKLQRAQQIHYELSTLPVSENLSSDQEQNLLKAKKTKYTKLSVVNEESLDTML